tara:strand:+ start:170 stop:394 length:225 start_codon:yes stop_codon:yes gene_type:complete
MLGFSIPKLLLLLIILLIIWNLFKFLEKKSISKVLNKQKDQYDEEDLTECVECGTFVSKTVKKRCTICTNESHK